MTTIVCLTIAWLLIAMMSYQSYVAVRQGYRHLSTLHSIPCSRCAFCTGDYRLKCTVRPIDACTEASIGCPDFQSCSTVAIPCKASDYVSR